MICKEMVQEMHLEELIKNEIFIMKNLNNENII